MRGNPKVELEHWLLQLANEQNSDFQKILTHYSVDFSKLASDLTTALSRLSRGSTALAGFGLPVREIVEQGWIYASLLYKQGSVRSSHLLVGCFRNNSLETTLYGLSNEFRKIDANDLGEKLLEITAGSSEDGGSAPVMPQGDGGSGDVPAGAPGATQALEQFTVDLTAEARDGELDPIFGREKEIRQIIDILLRRRQNNPILTGEAGVGKTAVVEGLALKIVAGDVPPPLLDVTLRTLDLGMLKAGAGVKGEFEQRLRNLIDACRTIYRRSSYAGC